MNFLNGDHLRVVTPVTVDGDRPKIENGQQVYKETQLPLTAKKHLEERNSALPKHLKMEIEVVKSVRDIPDQQLRPAQEPKSETLPGKIRQFTMAEAQNLKKHSL